MTLTGDAGPVKNPANTHIVRHAGRYLRCGRAACPPRSPPTLDTVGEYDFDGELAGPMTAHPRIDPRTGEMFFFAYSLFEPVPPVLRRRRRRAAGAQGRDRPAGTGDDARLHHHRAPRRVPRLADRVRHREPGQGPDGAVEARERHPHRGHAPHRDRPTTCGGSRSSPGHVQHFWNGWVEGDRIEFSGSRVRAPRVRDRPHRTARRVGGRATSRATRPASGSTWPRGGGLGAVRRPRRRLLPLQRRATTACRSALPVPVGLLRRAIAARRLRHHRQVRRSDRRADPVVRRAAPATWARRCSRPTPTAPPRTTAGWSTPSTTPIGTAATCGARRQDVEAGPIATGAPCRGGIPFGFHANWFPS